MLTRATADRYTITRDSYGASVLQCRRCPPGAGREYLGLAFPVDDLIQAVNHHEWTHEVSERYSVPMDELCPSHLATKRADT